MLAADPTMSFENLLGRSGAGIKCTACLLDLEYFYVTMPRSRNNVALCQVVTEGDAPQSLRHKLYRFIDGISPLVPFPLAEWMPVIVGEGIEQWVWVANHSLLYEGQVCPPGFGVHVAVRDAEGQVVYDCLHEVKQGSSLRLNISKFLPAPRQVGEVPSIGIGSMVISRHAHEFGFRGTIRPQIEIVSSAGSCAVHSQAPGGRPEQWFTTLYRPNDERLFLSIVNASDKPLTVAIAYPFEPSAMADDGVPQQTVYVPPRGARLHEIALPPPYAQKFLGKLFSIRWRAFGMRKVHVICATPSLDRFSIDHL